MTSTGLEPCLGGDRAQEPGLIIKRGKAAPWAKVLNAAKIHALSIEEQAKLILEARDASNGYFAKECTDFFKRNGYITGAQIAALKDLVSSHERQHNERSNRRRGAPNPDDLRDSLAGFFALDPNGQ